MSIQNRVKEGISPIVVFLAILIIAGMTADRSMRNYLLAELHPLKKPLKQQSFQQSHLLNYTFSSTCLM